MIGRDIVEVLDGSFEKYTELMVLIRDYYDGRFSDKTFIIHLDEFLRGVSEDLEDERRKYK